jgi:hypothetical protein
MFLFPLVYILSFIYSMYLLVRKQIQGVLTFIIGGLPIYINVLSVSFMYGFSAALPALQSFKEICLLAGLFVVAAGLKKRPQFHLIDKLLAFFFVYTFLYLLLPMGGYGLADRLIAFKALSIFPVIYFIGRFCNAASINIKQVFSYICVVAIVAGAVALFEIITYQHLHTRTGFTDFLVNHVGGEISGNYDLIWTFETETGMKRFGSILSSPLELAAGAVLSLAVLLALATDAKYRFQFRTFYVLSFIASFICIVAALSRASLANYFLMIYVYAFLVHNRTLVKYFHYLFLLIVVYVAFFMKGDLFYFVISTLTFENGSSVGHILGTIEGAQAMITHPFGMGLGTSGRVSMSEKENIGGENQLIIIGVQVGILMVAVYVWAYIATIRSGLKALRTADGRKKRLTLCVVLLKIGFIIPVITSYIDTFLYVTYTTYFLSGLMVNMIMSEKEQPHIQPAVTVSAS